jgi:DMSO reductase anchor subunit
VITLVPPRPQRLWGPAAVVNFAAGALGAGFYLVAAVTAHFRAEPALTLASWLGPALVLTGFLAVAAEAGRPLRGPRVLARLATSWMSRELLAGGAFAVLGAAEFVVPGPAPRLLAAFAAAAFVLAQGFMLRGARGVPAWNTPIMPLVSLVSAAVGGAGMLTLADVLAGRPPSGARLFALMALALGAGIVWLTYVTWYGDRASLAATRVLREGRGAIAVVVGGYVLPLLAAAIGLAVPATAPGAAALAGVFMIAGQVQGKALLILQAGLLRPIGIPHLRLDRRSS